jgi:hypothetical protein
MNHGGEMPVRAVEKHDFARSLLIEDNVGSRLPAAKVQADR